MHHLLCTRFVVAVNSEEDFLWSSSFKLLQIAHCKGTKTGEIYHANRPHHFFKYIYTGWPIQLYTIPPQGSVNNRDASTLSCLTISWTLNGKVVRVTVLIFTGDVEDKLQRLQWITGLSPWRPFRFCVITVVGSSRYNDVKRTTWRLKSPTTAPFVLA